MKATKLTALLLASLTIAGMLIGCNNGVTEATTSAAEPTGAQTTTQTPSTTTAPDNSSGEKRPTSGYKSITNSLDLISTEGLILLNDYLELGEMTAQNTDWGAGYATNDYTCTVKAVGYRLEIYAIEVVFTNNRFDFWSQIKFNSPNLSYSEGGAPVIAPLNLSSVYKKSLDLNDESTHDSEYYADADQQIPNNRFFIELYESFLIPQMHEYKFTCQAIPSVNELIEVRIWGKLVEASE